MTENRHTRRTASRKRLGTSILRPSRADHLFLLLLALVALATQVLVVQTHIHIPQAAGKTQSISLLTLAAAALTEMRHAAGDVCTASSPRDKYPINEDPSNCPLCQEVAHSGQFVQSVAVLASLPFSVSVSFVVFAEVLPSFFTVSHIWQGRAPPQS
jgi:hypothetical protein